MYYVKLPQGWDIEIDCQKLGLLSALSLDLVLRDVREDFQEDIAARWIISDVLMFDSSQVTTIPKSNLHDPSFSLRTQS